MFYLNGISKKNPALFKELVFDYKNRLQYLVVPSGLSSKEIMQDIRAIQELNIRFYKEVAVS